MELFFTQAGMVLTAAVAMCAIVYLCVRSPLVADLLEIVALIAMGFGALIFAVVGAVALGKLLPLVVGLFSIPTAMICWPRLQSKCSEVWRRA